MSTDAFDYVVIGAGSSGAAVARRLAEKPGTTVLLLEAGAPRHNDFWVKVPLGIGKLLQNPKYVWPFETEPQTEVKNARVYWPRGKLPGGSSSVNGMIYVRGEPAEYDHWAELGCKGWSYADLLPYFKRMERFAEGDPTQRGRNGPIHITTLAKTPQTLGSSFIDACQTAGIPGNPDYNGGTYEGVGYLQLNTKNGQRCSTAHGYLGSDKPQGLTVLTDAQATQILFDGSRATGVAYRHGDQTKQATARVEVILSAGPIKSPQLLELSGIGQAERLQALGIPVIANVPGVGENLVDHLQARITFECTQRITMNEIVSHPVRQALMGARYLLTRGGMMATPSASAHALARSHESDTRPTVKIQMHHMSAASRYARSAAAGIDPFPGFAIGFFQLRPESRGSLHATSRDPMANPVMDPRYLHAETDRIAMLRAIQLARKVADQPALRALIKRETRPGIDVRDEDSLMDYIRTCGQTSWHPIGTCKMGTDAMAVVSPDLRVNGTQALRVVDSSIMPTMPSSNTNAGSIAIGERAADMILQAQAK